MRLVEGERCGNIDVSQTITIGKGEDVLVGKMGKNAFQATSRLSLFSGVEQRDSPRFSEGAVNIDTVVLNIYRDIRRMQKIVHKIFLNYISLVTKAYDKIIEAVMTINFHDVPKDRSPPNLDHGLGLDDRFFANPRAKPPCQNNDFHSADFRSEGALGLTISSSNSLSASNAAPALVCVRDPPGAPSKIYSRVRLPCQPF